MSAKKKRSRPAEAVAVAEKEPAPVSEREPAGRSRLAAGLVALAFAASLLALFQWMELLVYHAGGELTCTLSETFDCAAVWSSKFAKAVQSATGMPVAGWGLVWGAVAFAASLALLLEQSAVRIAAVRIVAAGGLVSSLILGGVAISLRTFCITCIATYWIVFGYVFLAYRLPGRLLPETPVLARASAIGASWVVIFYLAFLFPGMKTPRGDAHSLKEVQAAPAAPAPAPAAPPAAEKPRLDTPLADFLATLPQDTLKMVSTAVASAKRTKLQDRSRWPVRFRHGPTSAPVQMVEWTDILCGHCAHLAEELKELKRIAPPGSYAVEPRQFPLDSSCNPLMPPAAKDETGVRCLAAKSLICLEGGDGFWQVQHQLFAEQQKLDAKRVRQLATAAMPGGAAALEKCIASAETNRRLQEDIELARAHDIHGTPLVLMNGREVNPPAGAALYAMILAKGDPNAPELANLPPPHPPHAHVH